MPYADLQEFHAGPLRVVVEHRREAEDEGPAVRVFGTVDGHERELLRFDCFANDPHYHYDPDGVDELHHMRDEGIEDAVEWTLQCLERNLAEMIRRAGFSALGDAANAQAIAQQLPLIHEAMLTPAV